MSATFTVLGERAWGWLLSNYKAAI